MCKLNYTYIGLSIPPGPQYHLGPSLEPFASSCVFEITLSRRNLMHRLVLLDFEHFRLAKTENGGKRALWQLCRWIIERYR